MKFKNKENERVTLPDGRAVYLSRDTAVCTAIIFVDESQEVSVLLGKRGKNAAGEDLVDIGKWGLCSGFLDWNESIPQAAQREVWEELGIELELNVIEPYEVSSDPAKYGQNITHHFVAVLWGEDGKPDATLNGPEVTEARWVTRKEIEEMGEGEFAFDHYNRILNLTHVH